jgi:DNA-binding HxlR family transcriptional regulator
MSLPDPLALRRSIDGSACSIKRSLDLLGEPWTLLILREAFWGVRRFQDFQSFLGLPRTVLTKRLEKLTANGLMERRPYREGSARTRHEYVLTETGRDLLPALIALMHWGDAHLGRGPTEVVDAETRKPVALRLVNENDEPISVDRLRARPIPT